MSDHCEVIDLTEPEQLVNHCYLITDDIIEIEESDSSFNEGSNKLPLKRRGTGAGKKTDALKNKRLTVKDTPEKRIGECPICCEQLGKKPASSTKCGHIFCLPCINTSLKHSKNCPQCRTVLKGANAIHPLYIPFK